MIPIPRSIKYDKDIHMREVITKALDPNDLVFIRSVLDSLKKDNAEAYIVKYGNDRIAICRKGLIPVERHKTHHYFALRNQFGRIIVNGKNTRRPESMICVLKALFRRNPGKQLKLKNNIHLSVAERCELFGYSLLKQGDPFK